MTARHVPIKNKTMKTTMRQRLFLLILLTACSIPAFTQNDYYMNKAKDYIREAEYYTRKAEEHDRDAPYYNGRAQNYLREADYYSRRNNHDKAQTYIRWAREAADKAKLRTAWANEARSKAQLRMKWAREAMEKAKQTSFQDNKNTYHNEKSNTIHTGHGDDGRLRGTAGFL